MAPHPLHTRLRSLGRRVRAIGALAGLGWGLVALGLVALAGAWSDLVFELTPAWRLAALVASATVGAGLAAWAARRIWREAEPEVLAGRLDRVAEARGEIVSGVSLLRDGRERSPTSAGLARIAIDRAELLTKSVPGSRVAPSKPAVVSSLAVGLLAVAVGALVVLLPRLALAQWLRFSDPFGDHPPYSPLVFTIDPGDVKVIYGQGVEIRATVEGAPVDRLELVLESAGTSNVDRLPMFPEGEGRWRAAVANVTDSGTFLVRARRARSPKHRIDVITVPRLTGVRFRVTPPAYTRRSASEGPLPKEGLAGLPGAKVEVWASSNRPLASGTLRAVHPRGATSLPLTPTPDGAREVSGSFEIREEGKIEVNVRDVAGQGSPEPFSGQVVLLRDERPFVRIVEPREVSFATPDVMLPVVLAAEDDYGIARIQLYRALNGSRPLPIDLSLGAREPTRWNDQAYLPLPEYGLKPGDEIALFARVEDDDPGGSKGSESQTVTIKIISREAFDRLIRAREGMDVLASKYREAERRVGDLAEEMARLLEELARLPPDSPLAEEKQKALEKLASRLRVESEAIRESAKNMLPYDIDRELVKEIRALAKKLDKLAAETGALAARPGLKAGDAEKALSDLQRELAADRKQFEDEALAPIEHLAKVYPLLEDQARFAQLYARQRDLADRLASLKGHDNEDNPRLKARMRDLETEQARLRDDLEQLLGDIEEHARLLPEDPRLDELRKSAEQFVADARASGASGAMTAAASALSEFSGTKGHASAKEAADLLEALLAKCDGAGGMGERCQGGLKFQPKLASSLGQSIGQMLADAGLSRNGQGEGSGNGFSARQDNRNNVGLYGGRPTASASSRQGSGRSSNGPGAGRSSGPNGERNPLERFASDNPNRASGRGEVPIPAQYRGRVSDYFRRVADETGGR